jgi:uncharacterized membrane protein YraQ (UPF0718 family)
MLIGTLVGGFIEVFVPRETFAKILPSRPWVAVFFSAGLGVILPVCECAVVPVVQRLLKKGVPFGAAIAYLLGGPIVNPLVAASTAVAYAYEWKVVTIRLLSGYIIAISVGILMEFLFREGKALLPESNFEQCGHGHSDHVQEARYNLCSKTALAVRHAADDFFDIGRFFVIGAFVAALMQTLLARQALASVVGNPIAAILLMMGLAVALSLCSEADAFVAMSFRAASMPFSAQMSFMVLGPMLDIKLILMYLRVFRKRAIVVLSGMTFLFVFLGMIAMEMFSR